MKDLNKKGIKMTIYSIFLFSLVFSVTVIYYYAPWYNMKGNNQNKTIIIVFDDSTLGQYKNAYPILCRYNYTASFAVVTDKLNSTDRMTWDMVKELYDNRMDIISHTMTHLDLTYCINIEIFNYQLGESRKELLNHEIRTDILVLPYGCGSTNPLYHIIVGKYYNYSRGTVYSVNSFIQFAILNNGFNKYNIPSIAIEGGISLDDFKVLINSTVLRNKMIILTYHGVEVESNLTFTVSAVNFESQIAYLKNMGVKTMTLKQFLEG
jgi:peptidoglycan/xylan/chitin deacetylase (PgdA/CDA1 family)